jgi:tRNA 2-thiouridine synthesizing protein B
MLLHTVNQSPAAGNALQSAIRAILPGAHLLLLEDGVYAAVDGSATAKQLLLMDGIHCYALAADVATRGLSDRLAAGIGQISYEDFVRLSTECHAVQSWY